MDKLWSVIEGFFSAYGTSFLLMVLAGFIIAFIVELGVKKAFDWLVEKLGDKPYLSIAKMAVVFAVTIWGTLMATVLIMKGELPLPGNRALAPFWFAVIYICQYVFSMYGIKAILRIKEKEKAPKAPKEPKPKKEKKDPLAGLEKLADNCYTDGNGNYFNKKGKKL